MPSSSNQLFPTQVAPWLIRHMRMFALCNDGAGKNVVVGCPRVFGKMCHAAPHGLLPSPGVVFCDEWPAGQGRVFPAHIRRIAPPRRIELRLPFASPHR